MLCKKAYKSPQPRIADALLPAIAVFRESETFEGTEVVVANSVEQVADELTSSAPSAPDGYDVVDEPAVGKPSASPAASPSVHRPTSTRSASCSTR